AGVGGLLLAGEPARFGRRYPGRPVQHAGGVGGGPAAAVGGQGRGVLAAAAAAGGADQQADGLPGRAVPQPQPVRQPHLEGGDGHDLLRAPAGGGEPPGVLPAGQGGGAGEEFDVVGGGAQRRVGGRSAGVQGGVGAEPGVPFGDGRGAVPAGGQRGQAAGDRR